MSVSFFWSGRDRETRFFLTRDLFTVHVENSGVPDVQFPPMIDFTNTVFSGFLIRLVYWMWVQCGWVVQTSEEMEQSKHLVPNFVFLLTSFVHFHFFSPFSWNPWMLISSSFFLWRKGSNSRTDWNKIWWFCWPSSGCTVDNRKPGNLRFGFPLNFFSIKHPKSNFWKIFTVEPQEMLVGKTCICLFATFDFRPSKLKKVENSWSASPSVLSDSNTLNTSEIRELVEFLPAKEN